MIYRLREMYLARRWSEAKGVWHYGLVITGWDHDCIVVHLCEEGVRAEPCVDDAWQSVAVVQDLEAASSRLNWALQSARPYALLWNNCEQFARDVATGHRESRQLQQGAVIAGLVLLAAYS